MTTQHKASGNLLDGAGAQSCEQLSAPAMHERSLCNKPKRVPYQSLSERRRKKEVNHIGFGQTENNNAPAYWDNLNPQDRQMAIASMLMQAGAGVNAANQPQGQGTPRIGSLFSAGVGGAASGLGNSMLGIQQRQDNEMTRRVRELQMQSFMASQAKEALQGRNTEAWLASLPEDERKAAAVFGNPRAYVEWKRRSRKR